MGGRTLTVIKLALLLRAVLTRVITWLSGLKFWQSVALGLALFAGLQTVRLAGEKRHSAKVEAQLLKYDQQRHADREAYAKAQQDAQAKNRAQVQQIEQQSQRITDETQSAYARDRAELIRLRRQNATPQGSAGDAGAPKDGPAPKGADADGLHLSPDEHLQASEIELRLMHLQNWVAEQLKVDPNK